MRWLVPSFAIVAVFLAPLMGFLRYHDYPVATVPVGLIVLVLLAIGLIAGIFELLAIPLIPALMMSAAVTFSIDYMVIGTFIDNIYFLIAVLVTLFFIFAILNMTMRPNSYKIILSSFLVMCLIPFMTNSISKPASLSTSHVPLTDPEERANIILHLVLDEHIGLAGIPVDIPGGLRAQALIRDFYLSRGFRLYSRAYSRYSDTNYSLPNLFNYTSLARKKGLTKEYFSPRHYYFLQRNAYFEDLKEKGFDIHVYQSDFLQFCKESTLEISLCFTYKSNSISSIAGLPIPASTKAIFIVKSFLQQSSVYLLGRTIYQQKLRPLIFHHTGITLPAWEKNGNRTGPIPAHAILDKITADVLGTHTKRLIYAHLLTPHYPYVYKEDCTIREPKPSWLDRSSAEPMEGSNDEQSRKVRYSQYFEQLTCLYSELGKMLDRFKSRGILKHMKIIIQGDHGSRITLGIPRNQSGNSILNADYIDAFSTLYAIKGPGIVAGVSDKVVPLNHLFEDDTGNLQHNGNGQFFYIGSSHEMLDRINGSPFDMIRHE